MRYLHSDTKCPVCKTANDTLIVDTDNLDLSMTDADDGGEVHHKTFAQYERWGNSIGNGFAFRDDVGMFFPTKVYEGQVLPLLGYGCGLPHCAFTNASDTFVTEKEMREEKAQDDTTIGGGNNQRQPKPSGKRETKKRLTGLKALKTHLRTDHGYALCELCVENKRDFVSKLARYTPQGLKVHQSKGDGERSGFAGHPLCEFCRPQRFYDIVKLHEHLNKEHYKCHICDKAGRPNQFFKDYPRLERHFDREHFLCHDRQCLAARFVVFENEIDLRGHERGVHGTNRRDGGTKIQLEFRVRREGDVLEQSVPSGDDFQFGAERGGVRARRAARGGGRIPAGARAGDFAPVARRADGRVSGAGGAGAGAGRPLFRNWEWCRRGVSQPGRRGVVRRRSGRGHADWVVGRRASKRRSGRARADKGSRWQGDRGRIPFLGPRPGRSHISESKARPKTQRGEEDAIGAAKPGSQLCRPGVAAHNVHLRTHRIRVVRVVASRRERAGHDAGQFPIAGRGKGEAHALLSQTVGGTVPGGAQLKQRGKFPVVGRSRRAQNSR